MKKKIKIRSGLVVAMLKHCRGGAMKNKKYKRKNKISQQDFSEENF